MFCEFEAMLYEFKAMFYEFKPLFHEFESLFYEYEPLFINSELLFNRDEPLIYNNILFLLSIFVEKEREGTEGVDSFVQYPSITSIIQPQIIEMRKGLLML